MHADRFAASYMYSSVSGLLTLLPLLGERLAAGTLEVDAFSLIASSASVLGFTSFAGDQAAEPVQWGHCDAGGDWTQDGAEHQLAWLQADLPLGPGRTLPLQAAFAVIERALRRVGAVEVRAFDAVLPLATHRPDAGRLAEQRDWLALGPAEAAAERDLIVRLDAERSVSDDLAPHVARALSELAGNELTAIASVTSTTSLPTVPPLGPHDMAADAPALVCRARSWGFDVGPWVIGLVAAAAAEYGVARDLRVVVRAM
jgi:hypothetical protein